MPKELGRSITESVSAPTLGIGAGPDTDGQVLVLYDALGFYPKKSPKFSKNFLDGAGSAAEGNSKLCQRGTKSRISRS